MSPLISWRLGLRRRHNRAGNEEERRRDAADASRGTHPDGGGRRGQPGAALRHQAPCDTTRQARTAQGAEAAAAVHILLPRRLQVSGSTRGAAALVELELDMTRLARAANPDRCTSLPTAQAPPHWQVRGAPLGRHLRARYHQASHRQRSPPPAGPPGLRRCKRAPPAMPLSCPTPDHAKRAWRPPQHVCVQRAAGATSSPAGSAGWEGAGGWLQQEAAWELPLEAGHV
jgi:hypothetical protein